MVVRGNSVLDHRPQRAVVVPTNDRQGACVRGGGCERALLLAVLKKRDSYSGRGTSPTHNPDERKTHIQVLTTVAVKCAWSIGCSERTFSFPR